MTTHTDTSAGADADAGAFTATHTADQVEDVLRGFFAPGDLEELADLVEAARKRRERKGKHTGRLASLTVLLGRAAQPAPPTSMRWYSTASTPAQVLCVLTDGDRAGEKTGIVPGGVTFRFDNPTSITGPVFCQPVDSNGNDVGKPVLKLAQVGDGEYRIPIRHLYPGSVTVKLQEATASATSTNQELPMWRVCRFCQVSSLSTHKQAIDFETNCPGRPEPRIFDLTNSSVKVSEIGRNGTYVTVTGTNPIWGRTAVNRTLVTAVTRKPVDGDVLRGDMLPGDWVAIAWERLRSGNWWVACSPIDRQDGQVEPDLSSTVALAAKKRATLGQTDDQTAR